MSTRFWKMSGAGNDFVVLEGRPGLRPAALARRLCPRGSSVGADGLLVLRRPEGRRPASMLYVNADGSRAFCGNGARCAALWLGRVAKLGRRVRFRTDEGLLDGELLGTDRARVRMPAATEPEARTVRALGRALKGWYLRAGVPHFVVPVRDLDAVPVDELGRALRRHRSFGPQGANVDFVRWGPPLALRTYERGVEAETMACGTGVTAAAVVAAWAGRARTPVDVLTRGGELMTVLSKDGSLWLEGAARIVYEGRLTVPA